MFRTRSVRGRVYGPRFAAAASLACAVALAPRSGGAQVLQRFSLNAEVGGGTMIPEHQRAALGYDATIQTSLRMGFDVVDFVAAQVAFSNWWFPSSREDGNLAMFGAGARLQPRLGRVGRAFADAHVFAGWTGDYTRFAFDVGAGFDFEIHPVIALGPVFRYGHLVAGDSQLVSDAQFWSGGLSLTLRAPPPPPPPPAPAWQPPAPVDSDRDGVSDASDACVDEPAGEHPDSLLAGCPRRDADTDTVFDDEDRCRVVPRGDHPDPDRPGCPDGDVDGDLVLDHADQCRDVPAGFFADTARPGCPIPDRDHDAVADAVDHCPDQPGAPSTVPARNGCPGLVLVSGTELRILRPIQFARGRDTILRGSFPVMRAVAMALSATPAIVRIVIEGHTDSVGRDDRNLDLSRRRAASVVRWLTTHGVDVARLTSEGFGEARPVWSNDTREGRAANRRVEFRFGERPAPAPAATASR